MKIHSNHTNQKEGSTVATICRSGRVNPMLEQLNGFSDLEILALEALALVAEERMVF